MATKATIKIAALNIQGLGNTNPWHPENKWNHINQMVRDERIGILFVSEAHLNEDRHCNLETLFGRQLKILYSEDPNNPNSKGVAIVLNRKIANFVENLKVREIIPG